MTQYDYLRLAGEIARCRRFDGEVALACFGGGLMTAAILLLRLLDRIADRTIMLSSVGVLGGALLAFAVIASVSEGTKCLWQALLRTGTILGVAYSGAMTPSGRLLRRSTLAADCPRASEGTAELRSSSRNKRSAVLASERRLSDLVIQAHDLTADEVELMWRTAPPRMPFVP